MGQHYSVQYQCGLSHQYWFVSVGKRSLIKCVQLECMNSNSMFFHLSLLDYHPKNGSLSDQLVSNNGDTELIMNTVIYCIRDFLSLFPNARITFTGNSPARDRLFKMWISKLNQEVLIDLHIVLDHLDDGGIIFYVSKKRVNLNHP
jgi:hypothetical protein